MTDGRRCPLIWIQTRGTLEIPIPPQKKPSAACCVLARRRPHAIVSAVEWLVSHYHSIEARLRRLLRRQGRTHEESEDLIQESLLRLHEYCRAEEVRDHSAFLVRTVKNLSIDMHRREHRHLYADRTLEELELHEALPDHGPTPDEIVGAKLRLQGISRTLSAISPRTRDIYFAHRAGYSYAEIGERLGVSSSTIEKHIARAVLALMDIKEQE